MKTLNAKDMKAIITAMSATMTENKDWLTELDAAVGDGDLGLTMPRGFRKASDVVQELEETDIGKILAKAGMTIAQTAPSTMGTLVGSGLMKSGKALKDKHEVGLADLAEGMTQFVEGIMARGKAQPGEKTIIDALQPAVQALQHAVEEQQTLQAGLQAAYEAACQGVEATKEMVAQHGRPAYYQEKSRGKQDPGATVGMLMLKTFVEYVSSQ
ncbi:dihydroxyacetone kinase subunit L [candidate division KSB3 bacterium]|jgi:dihydroxyacetone kinase-like protein|uniref:Dihydroxyacetone kinase subunit L n=1 Tax=candidate division KSB3 bacterium TaxID=2044937 RepID=A0A9D5JWW6_9BACT|nr:dihydroxyacetone kinase subunit L [candidate division KSB3 bacterium]MBD3325733.1 dihydroxyacetone kinase subunit L [candidate division KSB3 bacterium]